MNEIEARLAVVTALEQRPDVDAQGPFSITPSEGGFDVRGNGVSMHVHRDGSLEGEATVEPIAARLRLFALMTWALSSAWGAAELFWLAVLLITVPAKFIAANRLVPELVALGAAAALSLWLAVRFSEWVATLRPALFDEPVATVAEGVTRWPAPPGVDELLRRVGLLQVPLMVAVLVQFPAFGSTRNVVLSLLLVAASATAFVITRPWETPKTQTPVLPPTSSGGSWGELVSTALDGSRLALLVAVFGVGMQMTGLLDVVLGATRTRRPLWSEVFDSAMQLAVIVAVVRAKSHGQKTALVALISGLVGERLFGQGGKAVVTGITLFITFRAAHGNATPEAVRKTVLFELWLALGRIGGRLLAGLMLGPLGIQLGEAIGEQVAALHASARVEPLEVNERRSEGMTSFGTIRFAAIGGALLVALFVWNPPKFPLKQLPPDWRVVEGKGWSARLPGKPVTQVVFVPIRELRVEVHLTQSLWGDGVFSIHEVSKRNTYDDDGFLTAMSVLQLDHGVGCGGLITGVLHEAFVRCAYYPVGDGAVLGCVSGQNLDRDFVGAEYAFLIDFIKGTKHDPLTVPALTGNTDCNMSGRSMRDAARRVNDLR